jgi:hypothetical protein
VPEIESFFALNKQTTAIFRVKSNERISQLYQDLGCQYCLIQEEPTAAPFVPALTPLGFAHWETIQILSSPGDEWQRLSKVLRETLILADDSIFEFLPGQLSRHPFPPTHHHKMKRFLDKAIDDFFDNLGSWT